MEFERLLALLRAFHDEQVAYVLVGGVALNLLGARSLWVDRGDPELVSRITTLWRRTWKLAPATPRPGVQRFRSIEAAAAEREQRLLERTHALRALRAREPH